MFGTVRRHGTTVAAALFAAVMVAGLPAGAHITKPGHTWKKHFIPKADKRYFTQGELTAGDGSGPNVGSNLVHWDNLGGVPAGFADGTDDPGPTAPPAWELGGNAGTTAGTHFVGTTDDEALELHVNGERALRLEPDTVSPNVIGGFPGNQVSTSGATIGGGGQTGSPNLVTDEFGAVGGGVGNQAGDDAGTSADATEATVGGGDGNTASGSQSTVGGGSNNTASGLRATIGGGANNIAEESATVGGGLTNFATGIQATVGGGFSNVAGGGLGSTVGGGQINTASGPFSTVPGGERGVASRYGQIAHASGRFADDGDAQASEFVLRNLTMDDTQTELFLDGVDDRLTLDAGRRLAFEAYVVGGTAGGESSGYLLSGLIENIGGTTSLVGSPTVTVLGEDDAAWDVAVAPDNTNDALVLNVTGDSTDATRWVAMVQTAEVVFA